jgi:glutamate synthase domain-containing protein 3
MYLPSRHSHEHCFAQLPHLGGKRLMKENIHRGLMAGRNDIVASSMSINSRLPAQLEKALERNIVLRIGWTTSGEPVPKDGELGLCPNLPDGSKVRSLGYLGPFTAAFGQGGNYTHQGDIGSFLGAGNNGNKITCERTAGSCAGYGQKSGRITILDGVGDDAGAKMTGGLIVIRGDAGIRIGGGMSGGDIIVHGDVGGDPGAGMKGGRIIINGRCPSPPPGVLLRTLEKSELTEINKNLGDEDLHIPADAVCLVSDGENVEAIMSSCKEDLSGIALLPATTNHNPNHSTCDTVALIGGQDALALPIPLLPYVPNGVQDDLFHPCLVRVNPRDCDIVIIDSENIANSASLVKSAAGFAIDLDSLPRLDGAAIDGLLVALRCIAGDNSKVLMIRGVSQSASLHADSEHHGADAAISVLDDGSGLCAAATLPMVGRSASEMSDDSKAAMWLPWSASSEDLAILCASNIGFTVCPAPDENIAGWIAQVTSGLSAHLNRLGLASIDSLSRANLRACEQDTAAVSGLRLAGYDRPMPHWFAR